MTEEKKIQIESKTRSTLSIDAVELKTIELRLNVVKDATQRSRFVFVVMTIMTATILVSLWNAMVSWERNWAFEPRPQASPVASPTASPVASPTLPPDLVAKNRETVTNEWLKNLVVSVGLLGIRISTHDLAVVGSVSLIVVMVWFFFSQRRENRAIVGLLRDCSDKFTRGALGSDVCRMVYEVIVQNIVFIDMGGGDKPIRGLIANGAQSERNRFVRRIITGMVFLPPFTILMIVVSDLASLLASSYLRESQEALWKIIWERRSFEVLAKVVGFDTFALFSSFYTLRLCLKCREFSKATAATIKQFNEFIKDCE
jgi:hypothetical protein